MSINSEVELEAMMREAVLHCEQGDFAKAVELYRTILARYEGHAQACEYACAGLGESYLNLRDLDLAESYFRQALNYDPMEPRWHYLLGFTYSVGRQWDKAVTEFDICVKQDDNEPEYLRGLGWVMLQAGQKDRGLSYLHQALVLAPDMVNVLTDLSAAYLSKCDFDEALKYAGRAVEVAPDDPLAQDVYMNVRYFQKEHARLVKASPRTRRSRKPKSDGE